ncbi:MAG: AraC family transcriptional regulator [Gammaproteobacteria bacterium]|nr:MAG: AraC family transcriptional regulator [Gammaproteobacteria bacterium]
MKSTQFRVVGEEAHDLDQSDLHKLAMLLEKYAPHDGQFNLSRDGLHVFRASKATEEVTYTLAQPGICIIAQGAKSVSLAKDSFEYNETNMVVYAAEVPISVKVTKASVDEPYLCLVIPFNAAKLAELILKVFPGGIPKHSNTQAIYIGNSNPRVVQSAIRIMELFVNEEDADLLVPLVVDEIMIRLLRSSAGPAFAEIGITDSNTCKISKAISWLKNNFAESIKVDELSKMSGMSISAFHNHFKAVTNMTPLQFQKTLRLQEARNIMISKLLDAESASLEVGYASVSQFRREYARHFGCSPAKDIANVIKVAQAR